MLRRALALLGLVGALVGGQAHAMVGGWTVIGGLAFHSLVLTAASSSPWTVDAGWQNTVSGPLGFANKIQCVGGGATGQAGSGAGGAAYADKSNVALTPLASVAFNIAPVISGGDTSGGDSYFCNATINCASLAGTAVQVGAQGGANNGAPGAAASSVGTNKFSGGSGAAGSTGGGGGAGPSGAGGNGVTTTGGQGDNGTGGAGGVSVDGSPGTEWNGAVGSGGGAGGGTSRLGGAYGGAGAAAGGSPGTAGGMCLLRWYSQ